VFVLRFLARKPPPYAWQRKLAQSSHWSSGPRFSVSFYATPAPTGAWAVDHEQRPIRVAVEALESSSPGLDFDPTVSDSYVVRGLPYTIYLDVNGIVRAVYAGQATGAACTRIWDAAFAGA
jgi:hypothetical protein